MEDLNKFIDKLKLEVKLLHEHEKEEGDNAEEKVE